MHMGRPTAFTLPEEENFDCLFVPLEGDPVPLYLLVNGVADGLGARFLLLSL